MQGVQEINVSSAFSRQSGHFDDVYDNNLITVWARNKVRKEVACFLKPHSNVLELNCGTGTDSVFFAQNGHHIVATDNAPGMLQTLYKKIELHQLHSNIEPTLCSFNNLENLGKRQFDYVFSNFGGLNCTEDLAKVLSNIETLLKPGGYFSLVIMPKICPWDLLMIFKGYFKTAFRRFKKNGATAHLEGVYFQCYYYEPSYIIRHLGKKFTLRSLKSLSLAVPPPYIEHFVEKHPKLFSLLEKIENKLCATPPFNRWGDYYIITMQKAPDADSSRP